MGKEIVEFKLADGSPVYVEVDERDAGGVERVGRGEEAVAKAQDRFVEALDKIKPATEAVLNTFRDLNTPDEINLEFGIKLSGTLGALFASVDSEATFKVSLKWKNEKSANP